MTPFERAERAKQLLADPVLKEAFHSIRESLVSKVEASGLDDVDTHHEVALSLQLLKRLNTTLQRFIQEQTVLEHRNKTDSFVQRMRERLTA